jgi:hypothetical protein
MIREFKFFSGHCDSDFVIDMNGNRRLTVSWNGETTIGANIDAESELTRIMSAEIARGIDEEIISTITRRINGGDSNLQERVEYFERWLDMGGHRA